MSYQAEIPLDEAVAQAAALGARDGGNAASWVFDGNTPENAYRSVLKGIEDGDPQVLLTGFGMEAPVWSPDGTQMAFMDCTSGEVCQIAVMNADGTNVRQLTHDATTSSQKVDWQAVPD